ncbi:MAG: transposase, partial [Candidatus Aenigmarchaeota archaeon]|nr:transposase [Candidatus Aenigmarchaeota archaeon]
KGRLPYYKSDYRRKTGAVKIGKRQSSRLQDSTNVFANMISYKAEEAGCRVIFVDPKNTTKTCSDCGTLVGKELCERTHNCPQCGLSVDRDVNAAKNILKIATLGQRGSNACGDGVIAPSLKQEVHTF